MMPPEKGSLDSINWFEFVSMVGVSFGVGMVKFLAILRSGRKFRVIDLIYEPSIAVLAGMIAWALSEVTNSPDVIQAVLTSISAWAGPRYMHYLERKFFGGSRTTDFGKLDGS